MCHLLHLLPGLIARLIWVVSTLYHSKCGLSTHKIK
nr:MAG TPA: hypothetical protein [Caudoviricetes sp.]